MDPSRCSPFATPRLVLDGFGQMHGLDVVRAGEVGDGSRDAQDAVVGARAEPKTFDRRRYQPGARGVQRTECPHLRDTHFRVAADVAEAAEALPLAFTGGDHPGSNP